LANRLLYAQVEIAYTLIGRGGHVRPKETKPVVLVVDDEVVVRNTIATYLYRAGYTVISPVDGIEALELSRAYPDHVHLLITDVDIPTMSGLDLCEHLIRERPGMKVMIISGQNQDSQEAHDVPILRRPFTSADLIEAVRQLLASKPGTARDRG
jgi:CheY-like chemotaxis protein